jgi:hypothetical protein
MPMENLKTFGAYPSRAPYVYTTLKLLEIDLKC